MSRILLVQSEARALPLRDQRVHLCVTSPPSWNLRDYGTGKRRGGHPACSHRIGSPETRAQQVRPSTFKGGKATVGHGQAGYREQCPRCGAVRIDQQLGLEASADCLGWATGHPCERCYICAMVQVFREVKRVLRDDGTVWLNCGDSYTSGGRVGHGTRQGQRHQTTRGLHGTNDPPRAPRPRRLTLALQQDGWILRSDIIWHKRNCMPASVTDHPTTSHEYVFLLSKPPQYFYDADAIREPYATENAVPANPEWVQGWATDGPHTAVAHNQATSHHGSTFTNSKTGVRQPRTATLPRADHPSGRNARTVWDIPTQPYHGAHFACFPEALAERCIRAGTSAHGVCPTCASPWRRAVERQRLLDGYIPVTGAFSMPDQPWRIPPNGRGHWRYSTQTIQHGWEPTCRCPQPMLPHPATVLDPFCGSGTTLVVARALGRHAIGCDLSWTYVHDQGRQRLGLTAFHEWAHGAHHTRHPHEDDSSNLPLFRRQP